MLVKSPYNKELMLKKKIFLILKIEEVLPAHHLFSSIWSRFFKRAF